jgi:DNA-directed RNA polymerase subunit RPC12/RpoP
MTTITFACPECETNLKTSHRITSDQDIRCPSCGKVFPAPPETGSELLPSEAEPTEGQAKPAPKTSRTRVLVLGSALVVILFTAATAYFAWSAIVNRGRNEGTGHEDPLAYVHPDSTFVMGIDLGALPPQSEWRQALEKGIRGLNHAPCFLDDCKANTGIELSDLFDQVILAFKVEGLNRSEPPHTTLIAHSRIPFDQNKVRDSEEDMFPQITESKFYYKRKTGDVVDLPFLFMPSNRILVMSNLPEYDFDPLVEKDGTEPLLSEETVARIREMQRDPFWAIIPISDNIRESLWVRSEVLAKRKLDQASLLDSLVGLQAIAASGRSEENKFALTLSLNFRGAPAAGKALTGLQAYWDNHSKEWDFAPMGLSKDFQGVFREIAHHAQFSEDGDKVRLKARFTPPAAETIAQLIPRLPWVLHGPSEPAAQPQPGPRMMPPGRRGPGGFRPGPPNQPPPNKV